MIKIIECNRKKEIIDSFLIRKKVFVEEQNVSMEEEFDLLDNERISYNCYLNDIAISTLRVHIIDNTIKIQRVCTLKEYRNKGYSKCLIEYVINSFKKSYSTFLLDSQISAIGFYEKIGFTAFGDVFLDAGIEHKKMILEIKK